MRIISGKNKGRRITAPKNLPVRPTTDMAKESLFNILNNQIYFDEIDVLDLFAGTGNISYEFASRGAHIIHSVDNNRHCSHFIERTAASLDYDSIHSIQSDYKYFIRHARLKWDVIFADPPYSMREIFQDLPHLIFEHQLLKENGIFVLEHSEAYSYEDHPNFYEHRHYGRVHFSFFENAK
jgi:16S rRNA (guanine(966)-N(2))-methyltransferase RsmD